MKKTIRSLILLALVAAAVLLTFTGCPKACTPSIIDFADDDFGLVCGEIFGIDSKKVSPEHLARIESFEIITYGETNSISVLFANSENLPPEQQSKTVDITGKVFANFEDFKYFTGLKQYSSIYTTNADYSFLGYCKGLEFISISGNSECRDFSFLKGLTNLKSFSLESGFIEDMSVFENMTSLTELSLNSVSTKIDPDYLFRETGYTIEELGYDESAIAEISFVSNLTNLEVLRITSAFVDDLEPISGLTNLRYLDLSYNSIDDISPIANLTQLEYVDLTQNVVSDLTPLSNLDPAKVQKIVLDLCPAIKDWSPLDKFDISQLQGDIKR